jgi:hypothetical protein
MATTYAIPDGRTVMAATLYTGDGASTKSFSNAVNGVSFQPDLVWQKIRSGTTQGTGVFDSVRGTTGQSLDTSATTAEGTWVGSNSSDYGYVSSFDTGGFSVNDGATATTGGYVNYSGRTYVAWQWKASNTTAVSNTAGSITSTVSANPTAGFSVVTYTHNGTNAATVGHGLGVTPSFIINKQRSAASNWRCYHVSLPAGYNIQLNLTQAQSVAGDIFQTAPTSSVFTPGNGDSASGQTMVAYCFAAVAGYSAFGSYTGNGSADGPFVYLGFRPRFVMVKDATNSATQWTMLDTSRNTSNVADLRLMANLSNAENQQSLIDILSNGFKIRDVNITPINTSGATVIYMAFAENPFKYANAR